MDSLPRRVRTALGDADVTGWTYRVLARDADGNVESAVEAVRGGIGDRGNARLLFEVGIEHLDPVADADAYQLLSAAPFGSTLAYEVAVHMRTAFWEPR